MSAWSPADVIEMVKALFFGLGAICIPVATAYVMIGAERAKRAEKASLLNAQGIATVSLNVDRLEKNTNSISERNQAIAMKLGITEGIAQERASVQANSPTPALAAVSSPVPVADDRTAAAVEGVKDAIEAASGRHKD